MENHQGDFALSYSCIRLVRLDCLCSFYLQFHGSWFTICGDACPFHASMLRPASQAGPMHESTEVGEVSYCCAAVIN